MPAESPEPRTPARWEPAAVRALDVVAAAVLVVLLAPLLLALAVAVRWGSPGPALFRQVRVGRDLRPFTMLKFRSMTTGCDDGVHREQIA
ncbi:MAG TPA: sugar transferase, partial [Pseudonocardia sp.]|nr:sugar transferase [Pseudonocardia sp.]